jgi:photosystem II stability/assembly factor-like uncharacterized protein
MNGTLIITFVCIVIISSAQTQEWVHVNPVFDPPGEYNTSLGVFIDEYNCWWLSRPSVSCIRDGGLSWHVEAESVVDYFIQSMVFVDTLHGWILINGSLSSTKDGGSTWNRYDALQIYCISFFDSLNGIAGGVSAIYSTTDRGITWEPTGIEIDSSSYGFGGIGGIFFLDRKIGWAVGSNAGLNHTGVLLKTVEGGETWRMINDFIPGGQGITVFFTDTLHGYVEPIDGAILVTHEGGESCLGPHWFSGMLLDISFSDDSTGWIVSSNGAIWHTADRGLTWSKVESGTSSPLFRVFFFNNGKTGFIFGGNRTLLIYDQTVGVEDIETPPEYSFELFQNYPNRFNPIMTLKYHLPVGSFVTIKVLICSEESLKHLHRKKNLPARIPRYGMR